MDSTSSDSRWLKASWDEVRENAIRDCFQKCSFSRVENVTEEAQDDLELQNLLELLTIKVIAEEYLLLDDDVETLVIINTDANLIESYGYIYKNVEEMHITEKNKHKKKISNG